MRTITYYIDTAVLAAVRRDFQQDGGFQESMCFVTGTAIAGDLIVLTHHMLMPGEASAVGFHPHAAAQVALHERVFHMGLDVEAQFHSHPGEGINATYPSTTDLNTARRYEADARFLGAIFSEGGTYVRFFGYGQRSVIHICGTAEPTQQPTVIKLPNFEDAAVCAGADATAGLFHDRPSRTVLVVEPSADQLREGLVGRCRRAWQQRGKATRPERDRSS